MARAKSEDPHFRLRLPLELKKRVEEAADKGGRSINSEVVERLDRSFYEDTEHKFLNMLAERPFYTALPQGLATRIQASAEKHGRSEEEAVIQALEGAFPASGETVDEVIEDYRALAEEFLTTIKKNAAAGRREVEEYRVMLGTVRVLRYIIDELQNVVAADQVPEDVRLLIRTLHPFKQSEGDLAAVLDDLFEAMAERDRLAEEEKQQESSAPQEKRRRRLLAIAKKHGADLS